MPRGERAQRRRATLRCQLLHHGCCPMSKESEILPPTLADIDSLARAAFGVLPEELKRFTEGVVVVVQEFPDDEVCAEMELESPFDILGLYQGVSLAEKRID